jgi:hypothetical protein
MSTLVLMMAMAVPGNGPEMESGEIIEDQRLDLRGEWRVTTDRTSFLGDFEFEASGSEVVKEFDIRDEGNGRLRLKYAIDLLGIYKQQGDRIIITCAYVKDGWPTSFEKKEPYAHINLDRVKPRK